MAEIPNIVRQSAQETGVLPSLSAMSFEHERVIIKGGARSGLPVIVAVHSTVLGPALGGCRLWHYPSWREGLDDALRLSASMTLKCAVAGMAHGGGKTVVAVPDGVELDRQARRRVLLDVADVVESLGGEYTTGPDVGTAPEDMVTIAERTSHVGCRPEAHGGTGDPGRHTATGALAAIRATCRHLFGSGDLHGRTVCVIGLGHVGGALARQLAAGGARLTVTDIDPTLRAGAESIGARWVAPAAALTEPVDVLVPAALGGLLTTGVVARLRCAAIAGPANNQLADDSVAEDLHRRGICWAPDYVVSAGGVVYVANAELHGASPEEATARVRELDELLTTVLTTARSQGISPHRAARALAAGRLNRPSDARRAT
jgi:glutamate dehydrogenase/leucine dehydrogenase